MAASRLWDRLAQSPCPPPGALRLERAGPVLYFAHGVTIGPYLDGTAACSINARPLASPRKRSG